jgi:hypothetical protein
MRSFLLRFAAVGLLAMAAVQPAAAQVKALIMGGYNSSADAAIKTDLIGSDARFNQALSSSYDYSSGGLPTLAYLQQFDSVLVFSDAVGVSPTALSDLLGNYVLSGGGVVIATFWGQQIAPSGGLLNSTGFNPFINATSTAYISHTLGSYNALDPLMQGVTALSSNQYNGDYLPGLDVGATLAASWNDGRPLAGYNATHKVAAITLNPNVVSLNNATGDYQRLFANALAFTGGASATSAVPEPATWAMMLIGFGVVGYAMRRRSKVNVRVRFA